MKKILTVLAILIAFTSYIHSEVVYSDPTMTIRTVGQNYISLDEMNRLLNSDEDYLLLDNRKPEDWIVKNIKGSVNANMDYVVTYNDYPTAVEIMKTVLREKTGSENGNGKKIVLACYTGNRYATAATNILSYLGADLSNVFTLEGGNVAWDRSSYGAVPAVALNTMQSLNENYDWGDTFEFAKRYGASTLNLAHAMDVMTITTPCAFETVALDYGLNPSFYHMQIINDDGGDEVVQNPDKTFKITFKNKSVAKAELKWPTASDLAKYVNKPESKKALVGYSIYNDEALMVVFSLLEKTAAEEVIASLKKSFPIAEAEGSGLSPYYSGRNDKGVKVSFSMEKASLLIEG